MSESRAFQDDPLPELESLIRAAGSRVCPSDDLRPRVLEAVRRQYDDRRAERKLGSFAIAVLLLLSIGSPASQYVDTLRGHATSPSAAEIQLLAIQYALRPEVGVHWGLAEAFSKLRRGQADRLGRSDRAMQ